MGKALNISLTTGRVAVQDALPEGATDDEKSERTLALVDEVKAEIPDLEPLVEEKPREALLRVWVLRTYLDAHPVRWIRNYAHRSKWNDVAKQLDGLKERAIAGLPDGEGQTIWDDLPYVRESVGLLFDKLRAQGEVQRLILTPLGKLTYAKVRYQREGPDDLTRVCREIENEIANSAKLDDEVKAWGDINIPSLLSGGEPKHLPPAKVPPTTGGAALAVVGALLLGAGLLALTGGGQAAVGGGLLALGLAVAGGGVALVFRAVNRKAALPAEFQDLAARFRERLYLICCLRGLYQMTSRLTRATDSFDRYVKENGGANRWKRVKTDERDVTKLFAEGSEGWHPKETIETWLTEQVTKAYRLDSQSLTAQADLDPEAWDALIRAYKLSFEEWGGDGKLLDVVADLLFIHRGENVAKERKRVFAEVYDAWDKAERDRATK